MKTRWKIVIAVGIFALVMAVSVLLSLHVQPANELEAYKKLLRAKGEKLTLEEFRTPPVAPEDNAAPAVKEAFRKLGPDIENTPYQMQMVASGKALIGWMQADARGGDFTNTWDEFAAEVEANRCAIELLHQVLDHPQLDYQLDFAKDMFPTNLLPDRQLERVLNAAALLEMHKSNLGAAVTNIISLLALVNKDASHGPFIASDVRILMAITAVTTTWELLQSTNLSDPELDVMQNSWKQVNFLSETENAFAKKRAWLTAQYEELRSSKEKWNEIIGNPIAMHSRSFAERLRNRIGGLLWRSSFSYAEEYRAIKSFQMILETVRIMETNQSQFYNRDYDALLPRLKSLETTNADEVIFRTFKIPDFKEVIINFNIINLTKGLHRAIRMETAKRMVVTAIALKRFQLKYGKWPDTITNLVPEFISAVPVDPYDGNSLKYHPNADGTFALYSVGENGKDDGGDATDSTGGTNVLDWLSPKARDWVWPQPATAAEVEAFNALPPK